MLKQKRYRCRLEIYDGERLTEIQSGFLTVEHIVYFVTHSKRVSVYYQKKTYTGAQFLKEVLGVKVKKQGSLSSKDGPYKTKRRFPENKSGFQAWKPW